MRLACWFRRRAETIFLNNSRQEKKQRALEKSVIGKTRSPARETHALPFVSATHFSTRGLTCAIRKSMLSRIIISMATAAALFTAPVGLATRSCVLSSAPEQKACEPGCCANKICCAISPKNTVAPSQPLAKGDSNQQLKATGSIAVLSFSGYEAGTARFRLETVASSAHAPPRLALLCTLLI